MRKVVAGIVIGLLCFHGWNRFQSRHAVQPASAPAPPIDTTLVEAPAQTAASSRFRCDGRVYCSQMASCEEARWFLKNCPATKMDGDRDGFPCEDWCGHD